MLKQMSIKAMLLLSKKLVLPDMKVKVGAKGKIAKKTWNNSMLTR